VLIWQFSWKLFQEVRSYFRDPDYGDLTHPETGRNFKITASVVSSQGARQWTRYDLQIGAKPTGLDDPAALDHLYDLDTTFPVKVYTYDEQKMIFDGTWDPRSGSKSLPSSAASIAPKLDSPNPSPVAKATETDDADEFETASDDADEFETASDDDEWGDVLADDSEKKNDMKKKLDALKAAARASQ